MSFSGDLRAELAQIIPRGRASRETAAAALLINIGSFSRTEDGRIMLDLSAGNQFAIRKCFTLIQKTVNISPDLFASRMNVRGSGKGGTKSGVKKSGKETVERKKGSDRDPAGCHQEMMTAVPRFLLAGPEGDGRREKEDAELPYLPQQFTGLLEKMQLIGRDGSLPENDGTLPAFSVKGSAGRAYLREMFLCNGFMNDPGRGYHMEFRCFSQPQADQLREVLGEQGIHAGMAHRKKYFVVYVKDSEDIVTLLQLMGASVSLMATENARIYKEVRNNVNRRVNCETANIGKTVESAVRQMEDISFLREKGILEKLPEQLREAASLRELHPGASLSELGELADPPVGRSGMNHRLRKIASLAQKERERETKKPPDD